MNKKKLPLFFILKVKLLTFQSISSVATIETPFQKLKSLLTYFAKINGILMESK